MSLPKLKHKQVSVKLNNTSVVLYYSFQGKEMRYPTGIKISNEKDTTGKYLEWDYKHKKLKLLPIEGDRVVMRAAVEKMKVKQLRIDTLEAKANELINESYMRGSHMFTEYLEIKLKEWDADKLTKANTGFFDYFNQFQERKKLHFEARGSIDSLRDYNSTRLLLLDFQAYSKREVKVGDINTHWLEDFVRYMSVKHPEYYDEHKVSSEGAMKDSTIKKRLNILTEFFKYLKELKVVSVENIDTIRNFKRTIRNEPTAKETLDISEIHALYKFNFEEPHLKVIADLFVFLCLTGVRFQDLDQFDKRFIQKVEGGFVYKKAASKTGIDYNIPLCEIVIEILTKYNYQLPKITDQYGNRAIKEALKKTGMFEEYTQIKDKLTEEYKKRYDAITLHKGRNSFITNLVDTVPLNELMKYTGHKKLSTLQGYIDVKRPVSMNYIKVFDIDK